MVLDALRDRADRNCIAVFVDGPNIIRDEFDIDLDAFRASLEDDGTLTVTKVFLNQYASEKLVEAIMSQGFEPVVGLAGEADDDTDVDVYMAVNAMEAVYSDDIDTIVLVTRDTDFLPVVQKAKKHGKKTVVAGLDPGFSVALQNAADRVTYLE
jgi:uncharacterized protein (TIGR00288 family)